MTQQSEQSESDRRRLLVILLLLLAFAAGAITCGVASSDGKRDRVLGSEQSREDDDDDDDRVFRIDGSVDGLFPGGSKTLPVLIRNPNNSPIDVTSITVRIGNASKQCKGSNLTVPRFKGKFRVPQNGSATLNMTATLKATAPDACQDATFRLTYTGKAVQA